MVRHTTQSHNLLVGASEPYGKGVEQVTEKAAERFVDQMRRDHAFRSVVRLAQDQTELNGILRNHGFEFTMDELAKAIVQLFTDTLLFTCRDGENFALQFLLCT